MQVLLFFEACRVEILDESQLAMERSSTSVERILGNDNGQDELMPRGCGSEQDIFLFGVDGWPSVRVASCLIIFSSAATW